MRTLPKSLHTVTALARLAAYIRRTSRHNDAETCMNLAFGVFGYDRDADPYDLASKALAAMEKGAQS